MELIKLSGSFKKSINVATAIFADDINKLKQLSLSEKEYDFIEKKYAANERFIHFSRLGIDLWFVFTQKGNSDTFKILEECRRSGDKIAAVMKKNSIETLSVVDIQELKEYSYAFLEGMALGLYSFSKYKSKNATAKTIKLYSKLFGKDDAMELNNVIKAVFKCRDLINEPASYLTTGQFKEEISSMAMQSDLVLDIFDETKLASLKMGGILAVNKGSEEPPFMAIVTWKPDNAVNKKPFILVGKGITYDSGGYSIKPSKGMIAMKCDMGGAAITISTMSLIAENKLPVYVIGLIPATDNKINERAQVPGDVITMHDGTHVEVINTDAEGRLLLADALSYAKRYKPQLVIDMATLTGAAHAAIGKYGIFLAGKKCEKEMQALKKAGHKTYERLVEFPLWEEYSDLIKSKIADIKNTGGAFAGAIAAAKFLEYFVDYPWMHLDIAGTTFFDDPWNYHPEGGTGIGVRLMYDFFKDKCK